jgi:hypothetical protein
MLVESILFWTIDLGATDHIARDRTTLVEFHRIPKDRYIYMGNNVAAAVLGIGACKLDLRGGRTLYLHDVLYAPEVRQNLVSILALLQLGFNIAFVGCCVKMHMDNIFYGSGFVLNGFMVLNTVNVSINYDASIYVVQNSSTINDSNIITWHARLGHIGQDRLHMSQPDIVATN